MNTNKIFYIQIQIKAEHVAHTFNPSTQEAEAGGFPGQPGLQSEFQDSQGYKEKPCLKKQRTNKQTNKKKLPGKGMELESMMLREVSLIWKDRYHIFIIYRI